MDGQELSPNGENSDSGFLGRSSTGDENNNNNELFEDGQEGNKGQKRAYNRLTSHQIEELEIAFQECQYPDEQARAELSTRLSLRSTQVKFWFQNRRTLFKVQTERLKHEKRKQESRKLKEENFALKQLSTNPICKECSGPATLSSILMENHYLRDENATLRRELKRVCDLGGISTLPSVDAILSSASTAELDLDVGINGVGLLSPARPNISIRDDFSGSSSSSFPMSFQTSQPMQVCSVQEFEKPIYLELAMSAMNILVTMANTNEPLWIPPGFVGGKETLNCEEYVRVFPPCIGPKPNGFVTEATRDTCLVIGKSSTLVGSLMDTFQWKETFPCIIAKAGRTEVIYSGEGGTRNGALQMMNATFQVISPLVPLRDVKFIRFCKQHEQGVWIVVDVSVNVIQEASNVPRFMKCRRLPSGCIIQDLSNGSSKVTWIEHTEYDDGAIHQLYRPLLRSGMGFGAQKWLAALKRQFESFAILKSPSTYHSGTTYDRNRSMLKLARRMMMTFYDGICPATSNHWNIIYTPNMGEDVQIMTRKIIVPSGSVVSAATSVWIPVSPDLVFGFLRDLRLRTLWDFLISDPTIREISSVVKAQDPRNVVSVLCANSSTSESGCSLLLQETCIDSTGSSLVYAPVDVLDLDKTIDDRNPTFPDFLPSGFVIIPDGNDTTTGYGGGDFVVTGGDTGFGGASSSSSTTQSGGSIVTVAFQVLVGTLPGEEINMASVATTSSIVSSTLGKIRAALNC